MLYFAYGSNLNHFQMKRRCKDSVFLKKYELKGYKLTYSTQKGPYTVMNEVHFYNEKSKSKLEDTIDFQDPQSSLKIEQKQIVNFDENS